MSKNILFHCVYSKLGQIETTLNLAYTKERLGRIVTEYIVPALHDCEVEVEVEAKIGKSPVRQPIKRWLGGEMPKGSSDKNTLLRLIALVLADSRNTRQWFELLPPAKSKLLTEAVERLIITQEDANEIMNIKSPVQSKTSNYYFSIYGETERLKTNFSWFDIYAVDGRYYGEQPTFYLCLPKAVYPFLARIVLDADETLTCDEPKAEDVFNAESEALMHMPVIMTMFKQGMLAAGKSKLVMKSTVNALAKLDLKPIPVPPGTVASLREQLLGYAAAVGFVYHRKEFDETTPPAQLLKLLVRTFVQHTFDLFPIATQHITGVKFSTLTDKRMSWLFWCVTTILKSHPNVWINLSVMERQARIILGDNVYALLGSDVNTRNTEERINNLTGIEIKPNLLLRHIGIPMLRALVCLLASVGVVEVAKVPIDKTDVVSPFDAIGAMRLTALGRYVLELDETYTAPSADSSPDFEASPSHLIIRVLKPTSPLLYILKSMATETGNNRWVVTAKSFLAGCQTAADVNRQIDLFKQYVCTDPSPVWLAFFDSLVQRAQPLVSESLSKYRLYRFDPSNEPLRQLLDSDELLRTLITRVEGYRLLIHDNNYARFTKRLKELGYIM